MSWTGKSSSMVIALDAVLLLLITFIAKAIPALDSGLSPDACVYLGIARNIISGKGLIISYNVFQYWTGTSYPALVYQQSLFSIVITPILYLFNTVAAINIFNVIISCLNVVILYLFINHQFGSRVLAFWASALAGILPQMQFTSIFPWTEQLHILFVLLSLVLLVRGIESNSNMRIGLSGLLMGFGYLVRTANLFCIIAFLIAMWLLRKEYTGSFKKIISFIFGAAIFIIPFQLFCWFKYGAFYPEYASQGMLYMFSGFMPGAYYSTLKPVLRMPALELNIFSSLIIILKHIIGFVKDLGIIGFFILPVGVWVFYRKSIFETFLFILGIVNILFYAVTFYCYNPELEYQRYSVLSAFVFLPLIIMMVYQGKDLIKLKFFNKTISNPLFFYFIVVFILLYGGDALMQNMGYLDEGHVAFKKYVHSRQEEIYNWAEENISREDLVATDLIQETYFLNRPIVSVPYGKAATGKNFIDFLNIYKPRCIMVSDPYSNFIQANNLGYKLVFNNGYKSVFQRVDN
jgi:hypothetical protein